MIKLLDSLTINKIAAGEVIERPASVVKELLENSIDSKSTAITIEIKEGGLSFIRITDNGTGIEKDQVKTAFLRHATSKINDAEDLSHIGSLGFRGEALASIAAVGQCEIITKVYKDITGIRYIIEGGVDKVFEEIGCPDGTTIIVRNLFFNTPARRKFMKTPATELSYISELVNRIAMSRPDISIKFISNGQNKLYTSGNGNLKDVIYNIFGKDITKNLLPINGMDGRTKITGYIAKPYISKGNRGYENYYVNSRYIKSSVITKSIEEAYSTFVMVHKYPFTVINIDINTEDLDVNVHPTKMELKINDSQVLYDLLLNSIRNTLTSKELIPEVNGVDKEKSIRDNVRAMQKQTVNTPEPFEIKRRENQSYKAVEPTVGYNKDTIVEAPIVNQKEDKIVPTINQKEDKIAPTESNEKVDLVPSVNHKENRIAPTESNIEDTITFNKSNTNDIISIVKENSSYKTESLKTLDAKKDLTEGITPKQENLFDSKLLQEDNKPDIKLIGQLFKTYWLIEYDNKFFIMDQHAAHEKIMFERLMFALKHNDIYSQNLLPPIVVALSPREEAVLLDNMDIFLKLGYKIENFGSNEYVIRAVPANLFGINPKDLFEDFIKNLLDDSGKLSDEIFVEKLSTMACKAAIKGNTTISFNEANRLIDELMKLENPYNCPHGRPTLISMTKQDIEKKFKRIQD